MSDPLKVVIKIKGFSGADIWDYLETEYKINIEKITKKSATITIHPHINRDDIDALIFALKDIDSKDSYDIIRTA